MAYLRGSLGRITARSLDSPVLTTPALGTPSAGVMTNMTGAVTASIVNDAITLAKMASGTDGNIISYDASGDPVAIATGSDGQVLTSTGAGSAPAFEAIATQIGNSFIKHLNGSNTDRNFFTDAQFFGGSSQVNAGSTKTLTTPGSFTASACVLMGQGRSVNSALHTGSQGFYGNTNIVKFTASNTISLVNDSGYAVFMYFMCHRFS